VINIALKKRKAGCKMAIMIYKWYHRLSAFHVHPFVIDYKTVYSCE